ncbi:DNA adenine methylase [candidate division WOR-3 bacterium]|nr:DNA adenine methylase [candidate division WOR-3 bacterium]
MEILQNWKSPSTRYQGSKRKLPSWIYEHIKDIKFDSALDLFGGTGVVSYLLKNMGKNVTYNDYLKFNHYIGLALIENSFLTLSSEDVEFLLNFQNTQYKNIIEYTFKDIYYKDDENHWIDCLNGNIIRLNEMYTGSTLRYKRALAYYALFQSCLIKRPFNMFHRKNLHLRTAEVSRSFGNKTTWDTPFEIFFRRFTKEINDLVFSNGRQNYATNKDAFRMDNRDYDLVYIDPPYFSENRTPVACDYGRMYHFLEGIAQYDDWLNLIDYGSSNLHLKDNHNHWSSKSELLEAFDQLFCRFADSIIILSYKSPGIPAEDELVSLLRKYKQKITVQRLQYWYALNKLNGKPHHNIELLLIGQ